MIVVTGASGQLGRAIVQSLVARVRASTVGATARDPAKAAGLSALGVRVRCGDFSDPSSLADAFEGATQLLMVSSNAAAYGGVTLAQHRAAIEAARAAGVRRIVYTSHMGASATSAFPPMRDHHATEAMLAESGLAWTSLRNGFYGASGIALMGEHWQSGTFQAPADGKVSWTAHADLAEAAAIMLTTPAPADGPTPPLTGSEALDLADLAAIASSLLGRPVTRETIADDDLRARMVARGAERAIPVVLGLYRASRAGEFAQIDPTLAQHLGRRPTTMRDLLREKIAR